MSAMADLYTALEDRSAGRTLDLGQAHLIETDLNTAPYTPANPMIQIVNLTIGDVAHVRKITFEEHYQPFGWIGPIPVRRCTDCQTTLPTLAGGPDFGQPWRIDDFPRCSRHAF